MLKAWKRSIYISIPNLKLLKLSCHCINETSQYKRKQPFVICHLLYTCRLVISHSNKHTEAYVEHFTGEKVLSASTKEWSIRNQLYRYRVIFCENAAMFPLVFCSHLKPVKLSATSIICLYTPKVAIAGDIQFFQK